MKRIAMLVAAATLLIATQTHAQSADVVYTATYLDIRPTSSNKGAVLIAQYERTARAETGNASVNAFQEIGRANRFVVIEAWQNQVAFAAHEKAASTLEFRDKLKAIHNSPYDQRVHHGFAIDPMPATAGSKAIYVVTHVDVPGAFREQAETLLKKLVESSRGDPGHVRYDVYQQNDPRTNHFTVFATWDSQRAFDNSGITPHAQQFREALAPLLGAPYDDRLYQPIKR